MLTTAAPQPVPTTHASASSGSASHHRARPQARRKHVNHDDGAYTNGGVTTGAKRSHAQVNGAGDDAASHNGERRAKRKRVADDRTAGSVSAMIAGTGGDSGKTKANGTGTEQDGPKVGKVRFRCILINLCCGADESQLDFSKFPVEALYSYMTLHDLMPSVNPSPLRADDPPAPSFLLFLSQRGNSSSPPPSRTTPANRPKRRSSRLLDDTEAPARTPVLADIRDSHTVLASAVARHFASNAPPPKEGDTIATFIAAIRARAITTNS